MTFSAQVIQISETIRTIKLYHFYRKYLKNLSIKCHSFPKSTTVDSFETDANFRDQNVQRHSMTSLETARPLANGPSCGGLRENCSVSYLSLAMVALEESVGGA